MIEDNLPRFEVGQFIEVFNQVNESAFPLIQIVGEVASFKINQDKFVFFDIKDEQASLNCFMMKFKLNVEIEDGMKIIVLARPKLTDWGKFSLTIEQIKPFGEGSIKKSKEMLLNKLKKEGLFDNSHKQILPQMPDQIGVIAAISSAGLADFQRIIGDKWPLVKIIVKNTTVQGDTAPEQIVSAIEQFNDSDNKPEMLVILRGGGSKDDLSCFDDERIVRAIFASKLPIATGIGHEIDLSVADLVADKYFATPTHLAQSIVPDKSLIIDRINQDIANLPEIIIDNINQISTEITDKIFDTREMIDNQINRLEELIISKNNLLEAYNPKLVLERGYSIIRGQLELKNEIEIETINQKIKAEIKEIYDKK